MRHILLAVLLPVALAACDGGSTPAPEADHAEGKEGGHHEEEGLVTLTSQQIAAAGIQLVRPSVGGAGAIELPATIEGDPQGVRIVAPAIGGRVVMLGRNLGESVRRGETLAVIESREAAQLRGDIASAQARAALARINLRREQRLFAERVSAEQDLIAARTAAQEADIAVRQASQQLAVAGSGGGSLNRIALAAPISGQVIARPVMLGQTVAADTEVYRVANLATVSLSLSLSPQDAAAVRPGATIAVTAPGRTGAARVTFISPVLDPQTRLVPLIAALDNRAGVWRVGESVRASVHVPVAGGGSAVSVPQVAVQTVEGETVVFVRTQTGFKAAPVRTGPANGDRIAILSGLAGTEQIAATNSFVLKAELGKGEASHEGH